MPTEQLRILIFGAHPDDCEWLAGGTMALYTHLGHQVMTVSLTNGDAGHNTMAGAPLARRRRDEAGAAAKALGAASIVLDHHDGTLVPSLEVRLEVLQIMREFKPDLVMAHRPWDYHPDHRYTGVVVQDAINMVIVGNLLPYVPKLSYIPVMLYMWDHFQKPYPFIPDVLVDVEAVYEQKMDALHLYTSQMYEWLDHPDTDDPIARRAWLKKKLEGEMTRPSTLYRQKLIEIYGKEKGEQIRHAEAFEVCEYGAPLTPEARRRLFPFI